MGVLSASGGSSRPTGLSVWWRVGWRGEDGGAWLPCLSDGWGVEQGLDEALRGDAPSTRARGGAGGDEEVLDRELRHLETEEEELLTETGPLCSDDLTRTAPDAGPLHSAAEQSCVQQTQP